MDRISLTAGIAAGVLAMIVFNGVWLLPRATAEGRALERAQLDAATTKAIGELTHEADRARVTRRLCIERGGVYLNKTGGCIQREAE